MKQPLAWITGAGGLIGSHLAAAAPQFAPMWKARPLVRADADLTNGAAIRALFRKESPALLIHCAGLTKTPLCQAEPALARKLNVDLTVFLSVLAANIPFIFFSTDLVFDGSQGHYDERAPVNPLSVYGETKADAERAVLSNPRHTVIRTSLNAGLSPTGDRAFNEEMRRACRDGKTLRLFVDEFRSPIPVAATARAVWELAILDRPGLYHLAGNERLSRWETGLLLAERFPELKGRLQPASIEDYRGAPRPADTSLNCAKIQSLLSFPLPGIREWVCCPPET